MKGLRWFCRGFRWSGFVREWDALWAPFLQCFKSFLKFFVLNSSSLYETGLAYFFVEFAHMQNMWAIHCGESVQLKTKMFLPVLNIKMLELIAPYPFSQINLERPLPLAAYAELK